MAWYDFGTIEPWRSDPDTGGAPVTVHVQDLSQILSDLCCAHNERATSALGTPTIWPISYKFQTVTITNGDTTNWFKLTFRTWTTGELAWNISSADLQTALEGLSSIGAGNVTVTGDAGGPYTITFTATYTDPLSIMGQTGKNDTQTIVITNAAGSDYFFLTFNGSATNKILWNAGAAAMKTALENLPSIGSNNVYVTYYYNPPTTPNPIYQVQFRNRLGKCNVPIMTATPLPFGCTVSITNPQNGCGDWEIPLISGGVSGCTITIAKGKTYPAAADFADMPLSPSTALHAIVDKLQEAPDTGDNVYWATSDYAAQLTDKFAGTLYGENEVQTVTITDGNGGNEVQKVLVSDHLRQTSYFTLTFGGQTTPQLLWNCTGAEMQAALEALSSIGAGNVAVTHTLRDTYIVTFQGALGNTNVAQMTVGTDIGCDATTSTVNTGSATPDTFTLTYSGQTTAALAWNCTAAQMVTALEALSNIGAGNVAVTVDISGCQIYTVTFQGALAKTNVAAMTGAGTGCTPTIATVIAGHADGAAWVAHPGLAPGWLRTDIYMQIREVLLNYRWVWEAGSLDDFSGTQIRMDEDSPLQLTITAEHCPNEIQEITISDITVDAEFVISGICSAFWSAYLGHWVGLPENTSSHVVVFTTGNTFTGPGEGSIVIRVLFCGALEKTNVAQMVCASQSGCSVGITTIQDGEPGGDSWVEVEEPPSANWLATLPQIWEWHHEDGVPSWSITSVVGNRLYIDHGSYEVPLVYAYLLDGDITFIGIPLKYISGATSEEALAMEWDLMLDSWTETPATSPIALVYTFGEAGDDLTWNIDYPACGGTPDGGKETLHISAATITAPNALNVLATYGAGAEDHQHLSIETGDAGTLTYSVYPADALTLAWEDDPATFLESLFMDGAGAHISAHYEVGVDYLRRHEDLETLYDFT